MNRSIVKRVIITLAVAALFLMGVTPSFATEINPSAEISWEDAPVVEGTSAILMDAGSGEILYEKNAYEKRDPASITKILNCLVVLETMELDEEVVVPYEIPNIGTGIKAKKGEVFTVEQLLYAMMLESANDAAEILAVAAGGSVKNFCDMMNERAKRCGANDTNFTNPNGLNEPLQPNHRTTAYDLTLICREAMKNDKFREIVATVDYVIPKTNKSKERKIRNGNRCISDGASKFKEPEYIKETGPYTYEGAVGIKTGYTSTAGNCFCGWAQRGDTQLLSIVLNSSNYATRFSDVIALWDYGYDRYFTYEVLTAAENAGEFKIKRGEKGEVNVSALKDIYITLNKGDREKDITYEISQKSEIYAPVKKGEALGEIIIYKKDIPVRSEIIYAAETVEKGGPLSYIGIPDEDVPIFLLIAVIVLVVMYMVLRAYKKHKYRVRKQKRARINRRARRREWEKENNPFD